jgi:hypothetical protein
MILVRNVFQLKFGQAKPAVALWKEGKELAKDHGVKGSSRILTDLTGPSYTLVFETTHENLAAFENDIPTAMKSGEWQEWYKKLVPHVKSSYREILNIVE